MTLKSLKNAALILLSPLSRFLPHFLTISSLVLIPALFFHAPSDDVVYPRALLQAYLFTLLISGSTKISESCKKTVTALVYSFIIVSEVILIGCFSFVKQIDLIGNAYILKGTNAGEAREFYAQYVSSAAIATFVKLLMYTALASVSVWLVSSRVAKTRQFTTHIANPRIGNIVRAFVVGCIVVSLFVFNHGGFINCCKSVLGWGTPLNVALATYNLVKTEPKIEPLDIDITVAEDSGSEKPTLVMIIGESLSREHMSVYGYSRDTTPLLKKMEQDSAIYVFSKAMSPGTHTVEAFKGILTLSDPIDGRRFDYYNSPNIISILKKAGYTTTWISNQSKFGIWDNIPAGYGKTCDNVIWADENISTGSVSLRPVPFDGILIDIYMKNREILSSEQPDFVVFHLMGSHEGFSARYPKEYEEFSENDYSEFPETTRSLRSEYDNSVAYNDSVVSGIFNLFADDNAVVIYFSDHGLDIYQSSDDYCGHGIAGNAVSKEVSSRIPLIIYLSEKYRDSHPGVAEALKKNAETEFNTKDLIYTILDAAGIDFTKAPSLIQEKSLLR